MLILFHTWIIVSETVIERIGFAMMCVLKKTVLSSDDNYCNNMSR